MPQTEQSEIQIDATKVIHKLKEIVANLTVELATTQALVDTLNERANAEMQRLATELAEAKSTIDTLSESLPQARNQAEEATVG